MGAPDICKPASLDVWPRGPARPGCVTLLCDHCSWTIVVSAEALADLEATFRGTVAEQLLAPGLATAQAPAI
jgi:hypothetical protein